MARPIPRSHIRKLENNIVALIWGKAEVAGVGRTGIADIMQCSIATVNKRRLYPSRFTVEELFRLCRALDISPEELGKAFEGVHSA